LLRNIACKDQQRLTLCGVRAALVKVRFKHDFWT
jgi:hypothetical protein